MTAQEHDLLKNYKDIHKDYVLPTQYDGVFFRHVIYWYGFRAPLPLMVFVCAIEDCNPGHVLEHQCF